MEKKCSMDNNQKLVYGDYNLIFMDGGFEVRKMGKLLYFNRRPMYVILKTAFALNEFYDAAYVETVLRGSTVEAKGTLTAPSGSVFSFADVYTTTGTGFKVSRNIRVLQAGDDLGFSTKLSFVMSESDDPHCYNCFAPGVWYKQNAFAPDGAFGKDLDCEYFWRRETCFALPVFAMQSMASGETVAFSRWASNVTMRTQDVMQSENLTDPKCTIASLGMSRPDHRTLNYTYYGYALRKEIETKRDGLSIDYVYPFSDGQLPGKNPFAGLDYSKNRKTFDKINHPVQVGFEQNYAVAVNLGKYGDFRDMMRSIWRVTYDRMRDKLFDVDNAKHYHNCMRIFNRYTRKYGDSYGLPFACQLPQMDISCVSFQFGFVGQQPGIGYQLLRYGDKEKMPKAFKKGEGIINFWVRSAMTESGLPNMCYNPGTESFEPYPHYIRMLADGVEAILDAYLYLHKLGDERPDWLEFCRKAAEWVVANQNEDGSFYRAYNDDGSVRMDSKSNTPSIIRFLVQFYLISGQECCKTAAVRAGEWACANICESLEYRGGTCDNSDIQDKEAGIYALFGFLALYDLTSTEKWLKCAINAADYVETWTYCWRFPVSTPWPKHPFNRYSISGQSIITINGGADVYMAACAYEYYRLYVYTSDEHYLNFAEFIHKNTRQSNDIDGSIGYAMPGLGHESGDFSSQTMHSQYHWLPWCTFVEVDPSSRLYDTFGGYEIADAQRLSPEERAKRNRIYDNYV